MYYGIHTVQFVKRTVNARIVARDCGLARTRIRAPRLRTREGECTIGRFSLCTPATMPAKLSRRAARDALSSMPMEAVLSMPSGERLTAKQRAFAQQVAMGQTKASAYRAAYDCTGKKITAANHGSRLSRDARVATEIEAYRLAVEAEKHRTPAQLRALVVQQLVQHSLDENLQPNQRLRALELLGKVTEVAAFTERRETVTHHTGDLRARLMRTLQTIDVTPRELGDDGADLLAEIAGQGYETHPTPTPELEPGGARACMHTIPHSQPNNFPNNPNEISDLDPYLDSEEDPPASF